MPPNPNEAPSAIDAVFEKLLADILRGTHAAGARLPAERELARQLGASRPTLREALRRLGEWNLVEPRRGSGVVVRPYRDWSMQVIPAYMKYGRPLPGQPGIARMLADLFHLRRALLLDVLGWALPRIPNNSLGSARAAMHRAWAIRDQPAQFSREDFEVMRVIVESAGLIPGLWLLNLIASIWFSMADSIRFAIKVPEEYVETYSKFFDLIENGRGDDAHKLISEYIIRHDNSMVKALEMFA